MEIDCNYHGTLHIILLVLLIFIQQKKFFHTFASMELNSTAALRLFTTQGKQF